MMNYELRSTFLPSLARGWISAQIKITNLWIFTPKTGWIENSRDKANEFWNKNFKRMLKKRTADDQIKINWELQDWLNLN